MSERGNIRGLSEVFDVSDPNVRELIERFIYGQEMHELVDPNNYLTDVSKRIESGCYPVFYSNHTQHLNIAGFRTVVESLAARPKDMYIVIAHSLVNEGQDPKIVKFGKSLAPILAEENFHFIPLARENDILKLQKKSESKALQAKRDTFHNIRFLLSSITHDAGIIFFPEATTEGGIVNKKTGKRNGMIHVEESLFRSLLSHKAKKGRELLFVPVGMVDTNKILEPRTSFPHMRPLLAVMKEKISYQLGVDLGPWPKLAKIVVGEPIEGDALDQYCDNEQLLNYLMMKRVAKLLPKELQGFYRE